MVFPGLAEWSEVWYPHHVSPLGLATSVAIFPIDALHPLLMRLLPPLLWSRRVEQGMGSAALLGLSQVLVNT